MSKKLFSENFISLSDVYVAYRKAKHEAFYDTIHPSAISFAEFEENLQENIESLYTTIVKCNEPWWEDLDFIGSFLYIPKSIDDSEWQNSERVHYRSIDPNLDWAQRFNESGRKKLNAKFRLVISPTVEYQILSALWIMKVGHKFEVNLDKNLSYGNRLRRNAHKLARYGSFNGALNRDSLGLFSPYFSAYRTWRQKGLDTMERLVTEGKPVTAITMDLAGFYHNVSPNFLMRPSFLKTIGLELNPDEKKLTQQLLDSINHWYRQTPDYAKQELGALPVGLSASKIISNILLFELDQQIVDSISPAYYGRYVDDIFLVFQTPDDVENGQAVLRFLSKKIDCLKINRKSGQSPGIKLKFSYAIDSNLDFTPDKQKIFSLSSEHGLDLINQISSQIKAQSSEYRMLPDIPSSSAGMAEKALLASPDASLIADALRKADVISIRRLGLSLLIRDIENYSSDLSRENWAQLRKEFFDLVKRYLITPKGIFELYAYFPRVFRILISNHDFNLAIEMIEKIIECFRLLQRTTKIDGHGSDEIKYCLDFFSKSLIQVAIQSSTTREFENWAFLRRVVKKVYELSNSYQIAISKPNLVKLSNKLLLADLGTRSYKDYWYYSQEYDINRVKVPRNFEVRKTLRLASIRKFRTSSNLFLPHWPALAFPTRPLSIQEIALVCPTVLDDNLLFRRSIWGLRGARTKDTMHVGRVIDPEHRCIINVPNRSSSPIYVALTNFKTSNEQFAKALYSNPDRSLTRYKTINRLVNDILKTKSKVDYVVFPECSIPRRWAFNMAGKLARQGISLIAGIEYYSDRKRRDVFKNDCMVSLATRWPGYASNFLFMQPKLAPSHNEAANLRKANKKQYIPTKDSEILPIFRHGEYYFGILICSDLTNPDNRVRFQGSVDSLFVLEWNPDVKTFSFLVEGAAHDVHTFVIQVNNRLYGDSRVRAPYREEYMRDSVRIKGGLTDHFVIAKIDYDALRKFQRKRDMTNKNAEFKPVPIGFKMSSSRKRLKPTS